MVRSCRSNISKRRLQTCYCSRAEHGDLPGGPGVPGEGTEPVDQQGGRGLRHLPPLCSRAMGRGTFKLITGVCIVHVDQPPPPLFEMHFCSSVPSSNGRGEHY